MVPSLWVGITTHMRDVALSSDLQLAGPSNGTITHMIVRLAAETVMLPMNPPVYLSHGDVADFTSSACAVLKTIYTLIEGGALNDLEPD